MSTKQEIDNYLKSLTKTRLIGLIHSLAEEFPRMGQSLADRTRHTDGGVKSLVKRLRKEIHEVGSEPGWQDHWHDRGYCPDYSGIRRKLEALLETGHADEVLALGRDLLAAGTGQVEQSHDEGETAMEVAACMPVIVRALDHSSLGDAEKLGWAVKAVLEDEYELCEAFAEYMYHRHPRGAWSPLADQLLGRLHEMKPASKADDFHYKFERDQLGRWAVHALERAGRKDEIIPLCITEAKQTCSYDTLVDRLIKARRLEDAEKWIGEGIRATKNIWPGIAANLREKMQKIRSAQKNWPAVAVLRVEEFVCYPSQASFSDCKKAGVRARIWPDVSKSLLCYLEKGELPWKQEDWPLPESGLHLPDPGRHDRFPMVSVLIDIAILEKNPDQVLRWYDLRLQSRNMRFAEGDDSVASAVQVHSPDRAVAIWKDLAEWQIAKVKPSAYQEAARYLRKASKVMQLEKKSAEWKSYLGALRETHARKSRLIEVLDGLTGKPIVSRKRRNR